jgi:hypothetical protein
MSTRCQRSGHSRFMNKNPLAAVVIVLAATALSLATKARGKCQHAPCVSSTHGSSATSKRDHYDSCRRPLLPCVPPCWPSDSASCQPQWVWAPAPLGSWEDPPAELSRWGPADSASEWFPWLNSSRGLGCLLVLERCLKESLLRGLNHMPFKGFSHEHPVRRRYPSVPPGCVPDGALFIAQVQPSEPIAAAV